MEQNLIAQEESQKMDAAISEALRQRAKSALTLGIVSAAAPSGLLVIGYFLMMLGMLGTMARGNQAGAPAWAVAGMGGFTVVLLIAGIAMIVLGKISWRRARAIGLEARSCEVRRPPASIVAHVLGLNSFIVGIFLTVYGAFAVGYMILFAVIYAAVG